MAISKFSNLVNQKLKKQEEDDEEKKKLAEQNINDTNSVKAIKSQSAESENQVKTDNSLSADDAIEEAKKIASDYRDNGYLNAPDSLGLEKIKVNKKSDDDIISEAKNSLKDKFNSSKEKTSSSFESKINDILNSNKNLEKKKQSSESSINSYYDSSIKETENQALKRGLARSSIIIDEISKLEGSRASELSDILNNYQSSLSENENQIIELTKQREKALDDLDISNALELENKINTLTEKYNKEKEDAIKFNNNVEKLEVEYKLNLDKQKTQNQKEILAMQDKYGINYQEIMIKNKQYEYLKSYLDSLEPKYALNLLLTNKEFKNILGQNYSALYKYINDKV